MSTDAPTLSHELDQWRESHTAEAFKKVQRDWAKGPVGARKLIDWLRSAEKAAGGDTTSTVHARRDRIRDLAGEITRARASDEELVRLALLMATADRAVSDFDASWPEYLRSVRSAVVRLKILNALRILGQLVGILVGVIVLFAVGSAWFAGILVIAAVVVAGSIAKRRLTRQAWDLSGVANRPVRIANGILGGPARGRLDASGLYAEADDIWLNRLEPSARDSEIRRRFVEKTHAAGTLSGRSVSQAPAAEYAWLDDPRITSELAEIFMNIGGAQGDRLDRRVVLAALKRQIPSYASAEQALPVLRDVVERQWNRYGAAGQTEGTIRASERVLFDEEQ